MADGAPVKTPHQGFDSFYGGTYSIDFITYRWHLALCIWFIGIRPRVVIATNTSHKKKQDEAT